MASISKSNGGGKTVQFVAPDGKRRSIRLGKAPMKAAETIKERVEYLLAAKRSRLALDAETASWLGSIGDELHAKLARVKLVEARRPKEALDLRLDPFLRAYIDKRQDVKPQTRHNLDVARRRLVAFLGAERDIRTITAGDAESWLFLLRSKYADGTASQSLKKVRQMFQSAVRFEYVPKNPFADLKAPKEANPERQHFIDRETIQKAIDACPDAEWKLLLALSRYGGLRCPSEHLSLTWGDVDWERGRVRVHAPKLEHNEAGGDRWIPLFPELRPFLEEAFEQAPEGAVWIINRYRRKNSNLRTQFERILCRAGVKPWPRLFHNLRASRQTELTADYPVHVVCAWIGNSALIAQKHYLQVRDEDFERAARGALQKAVQQPAETPLESVRNGPQEEKREEEPDPVFAGKTTALATCRNSLQDNEMPPRRFELRS
ncbi:MAG: tyrosine-type recombinase/integrase [Gemmataceae bacterium]